MTFNWMEEVLNRKEEILKETQAFLQIKSVLDEEKASEGAPFGPGIKEALEFMLQKGEQDGFTAKNLDGYAGHLEFGDGPDLLGILCHVDVVPEGDGWTTDPFSADIRDGKIYARGAIDDKGPTMAAYFAMKLVKEMNVPLKKRVRMILGTDEESDWRCMDHYFKHEEMPAFGFAPDADFPIIFAEKGIADIELITKGDALENSNNHLISFESGRRFNMVPDDAQVILHLENPEEVKEKFEAFLQEQPVNGKATVEGHKLFLQIEGVSAHGSVPTSGKNAGLYSAKFLKGLKLDKQGEGFVDFLDHYLVDDGKGEKLGIQAEDDVSGELTVNVGLQHYRAEEGGKVGLNIRYPVKHQFETTKETLEAIAGKHNMKMNIVDNSTPHHVPKDTEWLKTLQRVYEEQTGDKAELISIGGGTYARVLENGVAFGPLFPGREEVAHQKDEYMWVEDLLKATAIYAQAIYELATE
ncbi:dipeptidase PepV [Bacillus tianshenii]|nr:dipeptidase PepV [Bacillus tianshenii]